MEINEQWFRLQRAGTEVAGFRQNAPEHNGRGQRKEADRRQRHAPAEEIGKHPSKQTSTHPANRVTADI